MKVKTHTINWERLIDILSTTRCASSDGEEMIIDRYIAPHTEPDYYGNYYRQIGEPNGVMFSCHTDTVHDPKLPVRQRLGIIETDDTLVVMDKKHVLGADDGAGIELMLTMMEHQVPGLYVFHREEECGGRGSDYFSKSDLYQGINKCIAFDRKGTSSIITHQMTGRCCSEKFGSALASALNKLDGSFKFVLDSTGTFTDSANYTHEISECTNLSVGYEKQHTEAESLDVHFLDDLTCACIKLDWASLPAERDPYAQEYDLWNSHGYYGSNAPDMFEDWYEVEEFVYSNPSDAAELLFDLLYDKGRVKTSQYANDFSIDESKLTGYTWSDD